MLESWLLTCIIAECVPPYFVLVAGADGGDICERQDHPSEESDASEGMKPEEQGENTCRPVCLSVCVGECVHA